jgi:nucleoside-diphosphate-sugar epimerase
MSKRILITGGSGFIASYVARSCADLNCEIILQSRAGRVSDDLAHCQAVKLLNCSFLALDPEILNSVDCIIHLASAGVSPRKSEWDELEKVNIKGTLAMCQLAQKLKANIVIAGSYAEYGRSSLRYEEIPVDAPLEPTFPYAVSKAAGCQVALGFARSEGLGLAYLRIFSAFGPGQHSSNLWPSLINAAKSGQDFGMTEGQQLRDFIPVEDVAKRIARAATELEMREGSPYVSNVASGNPITVREFSEYWWNRCNPKGRLKIGDVPYRDNEVMRFIPSLKSAYL